MSGRIRPTITNSSPAARVVLFVASAAMFAVVTAAGEARPIADRITPPWSATMSAGSATPFGRTVDQNQEAAVAALISAFDAAWNVGDASKLSALYTEDAEFINILGTILPGAAAIRAQHVFLFAGPFRGSRSASTVRRVTFLTGTTALVDTDTELTGYVSLSPGIRPTVPGALRARFKHAVAKRGGAWRITSTQGTAVQPAM
jgi:uncharacterized protein (TIGR02246 family)